MPVTLTDVVQVPFIESTIMQVIRAERKIAELEPKAANTQLTIHCRNTKQAVNVAYESIGGSLPAAFQVISPRHIFVCPARFICLIKGGLQPMAKHKSFLVCRDNNAISIVEIIQ